MKLQKSDIKRVGLCCLTLFSVFIIKTANAQSDTSIVVDGVRVGAVINKNPEVKEHNPKKALLLSAILPGAGQVYNRQGWKVPVIYAAIGGIAYYTYINYNEMTAYKDEYLYRVTHDDMTQNPDMSDKPTANIYNLYQAYNKTFQLSVIISVAVYGINLLDAYVFGHLFDFQIDDDLSLNISPTVAPYFNAFGSAPQFRPMASISLRF